MLSQKITNQITLIAYATVSNLFAAFHNPKMRGEKFTWDKFPDIAESMVATQVFCNVVCKSQNQQQKAEEQGKKVGREIAINLVNKMTEK
jgi:hypothetical protein